MMKELEVSLVCGFLIVDISKETTPELRELVLNPLDIVTILPDSVHTGVSINPTILEHTIFFILT
jgi:hypothetical protein